jgi:HEPN domain-containing protein
MTDRNPAAAEAWIERAKSDLRSSEALFDLEPPELSQAAFHAQQAGEKYLKAYLAFLNEDIDRIHDLGTLVDRLRKEDSEFQKLYDAADILTPFAVAARYPFTHINPDEHDVEEAIDAVETIQHVVEDKIEF